MKRLGNAKFLGLACDAAFSSVMLMAVHEIFFRCPRSNISRVQWETVLCLRYSK